MNNKNAYDRQLIRALLTKDVVRFCHSEEVTRILADKRSEANIRLLESFLNPNFESMDERERALYAAVALAIFDQKSGISVLQDFEKYFMTNTGIESMHVRAALILIGENPERVRFANVPMSPDLCKSISAEP
ncbi:MAG: hypothetical protein HYY14_06120 [Candidatus Omnitrophica bacterium]|nr:hypothetical protein [Candidatus Omnitrophota bacterium]